MRREVGDEPDAFVDTVEVPCDISSLDRMREAILATEAEGALKRKACLVCEEIFVNIVSYSEADRVWFAVRSEGPARLSVTLVDNGSAFDASAAPLPDPEFEDLDSGGMGIGLVRELVSDMDYRRMDDRNILVLQVVS
jgi:anti-sigma regulatory factor (Ser/Thr protein kinase)